MEDPSLPVFPHRNSKKRFFGEGSSSTSLSFLDIDDIVEISPPPTWKSKPPKQKSIVSPEIIVVDDEDPDDVVIIDEKFTSNGKGKKPMLNHLAGREVITLDGGPSTKSNEFVKRNLSPQLSFIDDDFDLAEVIYGDHQDMLQSHSHSVNSPSGTEAIVPPLSATVASEKHAIPGKSSMSKLTRSLQSIPLKSSMSKFACYGSKLRSSRIPTTSSHVQTTSVIQQPMPQSPFAHTSMKSATSSFPSMHHPYGSAHTQWPNKSFYGNQNPSVTGIKLPIARLTRNNVILEDGIAAEISPAYSDGQNNSSQNSILRKLELFKKFDTLEDHLGHFYDKTKESAKPSKSWANKIADEWRLLEKDLPDSIYVRVYEARMDLLRAVMMGADGTPYHDGLFFFDVHFPASYPKKPPLVNYHAHGLRINPNLYNCGKVCLSLLGTWSGKGDEQWRPLKSNMLQVLVSIQGLVLNADPYYNEPGYASSKNTPYGKQSSENYSENAFLLSLKTMLYTMRNPPKYFEDLVYGHFYNRSHDILAACRAYLDGVEVGSYVKGKTQAEQKKSKTCSELLRTNLPSYVKSFVEAFTKIGVEDCEKYLIH